MQTIRGKQVGQHENTSCILAIFFDAMFFTADGNGAVNQSQDCINLGAKHIFNAYAMGCTPGGLNTNSAKRFFSSKCSDQLREPPSFLFDGYWGYFEG